MDRVFLYNTVILLILLFVLAVASLLLFPGVANLIIIELACIGVCFCLGRSDIFKPSTSFFFAIIIFTILRYFFLPLKPEYYNSFFAAHKWNAIFLCSLCCGMIIFRRVCWRNLFFFKKVFFQRQWVSSATNMKMELFFFTAFFLFYFLLIYLLSPFGFNLVLLVKNMLKFRYMVSNNGSAYFLRILLFFGTMFYFSAAYNLFLGKTKKLRSFILLSIYTFSLILLGTRGLLFFNIIFLVILYNLLKKPINLLFLFAVFLIAGYIVAELTYLRNTHFLSSISVSDIFNIILKRGDAFNNLVHHYYRIKNFDFLLGGKSIPNFFVQVIPRYFYPSKPHLFTIQLTKILMPPTFRRHVSLAYSGFAEMYMNFRLFGIVLMGFFISLVLSVLNYIYEFAREKRSFLAAICVILFFTYPIGLFAAGMINSSANIDFLIHLVWFMLFCKIFTRRIR